MILQVCKATSAMSDSADKLPMKKSIFGLSHGTCQAEKPPKHSVLHKLCWDNCPSSPSLFQLIGERFNVFFVAFGLFASSCFRCCMEDSLQCSLFIDTHAGANWCGRVLVQSSVKMLVLTKRNHGSRTALKMIKESGMWHAWKENNWLLLSSPFCLAFDRLIDLSLLVDAAIVHVETPVKLLASTSVWNMCKPASLGGSFHLGGKITVLDQPRGSDGRRRNMQDRARLPHWAFKQIHHRRLRYCVPCVRKLPASSSVSCPSLTVWATMDKLLWSKTCPGAKQYALSNNLDSEPWSCAHLRRIVWKCNWSALQKPCAARHGITMSNACENDH